MRKYPEILINTIETSGLNPNTISKASGVSNTYLTKLIRRQVNHPGKDKITSILLALNHSITDINRVLAEYDYQPLNRHDIPALLVNNGRRKIEGRIIHHYSHLYLELLLNVFEGLGGTKVLVKGRPSGVFLPVELLLMKEFPYEADDDAARFLVEFTGELFRNRRSLFLGNCQAGARVETYMCRDCLLESLKKGIGPVAQKETPRKVELQARYYANAVSASLKNPARHLHRIVRRCSSFDFQIQDAEGAGPKVNYNSSMPHSYDNQYDKLNLEGFSSGAPAVVQLFMDEVEMCRGVVETGNGLDTAEGFHQYIREQFCSYGVGELFDAALAGLMEKKKLVLH